MKFKYAIYAFLFLSLGFAAVTGYLFYSNRSAANAFGEREAFDRARVGARGIEVPDTETPVSGKGGSLIIAYAGDIRGSMDPCG